MEEKRVGAKKAEHDEPKDLYVFRGSLVVTFAGVNDLLSFTPALDGDQTLLCTGIQNAFNSLLNILKMSFSGESAVFLDLTFLSKKLKEVTIDGETRIFVLSHDWTWNHITSAECLFVLPVCKDVLTCDHSLG